MKSRLMAGALGAGLWFSSLPAHADQGADLVAIKTQLDQIQHDYAAKIQSLEKRLAKAEAEVKAAKIAAVHASKTASAAQNTAQSAAQTADTANQAAQQVATAETAPAPAAPTSANAYNPGIAAVLNGFYMAASRDPGKARIPGFALGDDAAPPPRGFSIGESEVSFAANIDPYLYGFLDVSFKADNTPSVEEAYIQSKDLPDGFTVKGGRFLSGIGYINERHSHDWSFSDAPLPYRAFLNSQYGDDGLQVRWLAPTDLFLEFGAEIFRGDAYPSAGASNNGQGTYTAFVHSGGDINDSSSWLAGLSYLHSRANSRDTGIHLFDGTDDLGILSLVYKWAPGGNPVSQNLNLVSEIFYGRERGSFDATPFSQDRWGWYAQGVYQFMPRWSFGLRYAQVGTSNVPLALLGTDLDNFGHSPRAETALVEFDTSEFGRFRVQYTHDDASLKSSDELLFQYTVIYGPHGAHRY